MDVRMRLRTQQGLTLLELLISLSLIAILTVSAFSEFGQVLQQHRMSTQVNMFVAALHLARQEAVKHAAKVVLCPSRDGDHCGNSADWQQGWIVFSSDDREHDRDEPVLQTGNPLPGDIRLDSSNHRRRIIYQPDGRSAGSNASFTFCDARKRAKPRVICLSNSGRPRLTASRCNGKPVDC